MDKETAKYIVTYFFHLLPDKEKLAWKHHSSILKLEDNNNPKEVIDLLKDGYDKFEIETAKKNN